MGRARRHEPGRAAGFADVRNAGDRAAGHPPRPAHGPLHAALDRRGLHARGNGPGAERWPHRRPGRPRAHVHRWLRALHRGFDRLRARTQCVPPRHRPPPSGRRWRVPHGQLRGPRHGRIPASRARACPRYQRDGRRRRPDPRPDPGWLPDELRLADRLLVQRPDRRPRHDRGRDAARRAGPALGADRSRSPRQLPVPRRPAAVS